MTITDFLLARIAEDEAAARGVPCDEAGWFAEELTWSRPADAPREWIVDSNPSPICHGNSNRRVQEHIARWDPYRVLAQCEAYRAIIALHVPVDYSSLGMTSPNACEVCGIDTSFGDWEWDRDSYPCATLRVLAAFYDGHPDYQQEWRP